MNLLLAALLLVQDKSAEQIIEQLRSDKVEVRDSASRELRKLGEEARLQLQKVAEAADQELAGRARILLDALDSDAAERVFRKIENTVLRAKSARVTFTGVGKLSPDITLEEKGTLLLKEGGKVHLAATTIVGKDKFELLVASDGQTTTALVLWWPVDAQDGEGHLRGDHGYSHPFPELTMEMAQGLIRLSQAYTSSQLRTRICTDGKLTVRLDAGKSLERFKLGPNDGSKRTLSYEIKDGASPNAVLEIKLWYDPATYTLARRVHTLKTGTLAETVLDETYEVYTLNADLPDQKFKLPDEK